MKNKVFIYFLFFCGFLTSQSSLINAQETRATVTLKEELLRIDFITEMRDVKNVLMNRSFDTYVYLQNRNIIHRIMIDKEAGIYFGYDFVVEPDALRENFLISITPLSNKPKSLDKLNKFGSNLFIKYPEPQMLKEGEILKLGLLENPQTKERITDLIKVSRISPETDKSKENFSVKNGEDKIPPLSENYKSSKSTTVKSTNTEPRDLTPEAIVLQLNKPRLFINDIRITTSARENHAAGEGDFLYLYVPGKGRFIFSLTPRQNYDFKKIGFVESNQISFTFGGDKYQLISGSPIIELSGKWNLWVFPDSEYKPKTRSLSESYGIGITKLDRKF